MIVSLNDFKEKSRAIFYWLGENLKEISLVIVINQDFKLLKNSDVLLNLDSSMFETLLESLIVCIWNSKEFNSSFRESSDSLYDIWGGKSNVLNTCSTIIIYVFLNLRLPLSISWLIDRHLDLFIEVTYDN